MGWSRVPDDSQCLQGAKAADPIEALRLVTGSGIDNLVQQQGRLWNGDDSTVPCGHIVHVVCRPHAGRARHVASDDGGMSWNVFRQEFCRQPAADIVAASLSRGD